MREELEKEELTKEEVNVYSKGCGNPRHVCKTDCGIISQAFVSTLD